DGGGSPFSERTIPHTSHGGRNPRPGAGVRLPAARSDGYRRPEPSSGPLQPPRGVRPEAGRRPPLGPTTPVRVLGTTGVDRPDRRSGAAPRVAAALDRPKHHGILDDDAGPVQR